jgi:hypothetical protein
MDDAFVVRGFQRRGDLPRDLERLFDRQRSSPVITSASVGPSTSSMTR